MPLPPGSRIGHYDIAAAIGAGGMGEVYRARDTRLDRDVALKILPESFAADPDRLMRFTREAKTLAALNHPNIAAIYGIEAERLPLALVMELVEGDDLSQRIAKGAMPVEEAVSVARQIADALEAAHEQGIIHRDLKPANIKVRPDGTVKVLDFGLAKALDPPSPEASAGKPSYAMNSPTMTSPAMTEMGLILGTAAYMSPEQARGKPVDKRADIWSFGVVLYEMLTGATLFAGETVSDVLAAVLRADIDLATLPPAVPPRLRQLLARCLEKDPRRRLRDIGEARIWLDSPDTIEPRATTTTAPAASGGRVWPMVAAAAALVAATLGAWIVFQPGEVAAPIHASIQLPPGTEYAIDSSTPPNMAIAPDGSAIVFAATALGARATETSLYVRRLADNVATLVPDSTGGRVPFFSWDSRSIAFLAGNVLKKASLSGGAPSPVTTGVQNIWGSTWLSDGTIVYADPRPTGEMLYTVSDQGGTPALLSRMDNLDRDNSFPRALDAEHLLMTMWTGGLYTDAKVFKYSRQAKATTTQLVEGGSQAQLVDGRFLVYARGSELLAQPYPGQAGQPGAVKVLDGVLTDTSYATTQFDVSVSGALVYAPAPARAPTATAVWINADATTTALFEDRNLEMPKLSADGRYLTYVTREASREKEVWVFDTVTRRPARVTNTRGEEYSLVISGNGDQIFFSAWRDKAGLYQTSTRSTGEKLLPIPSTRPVRGWSVTSDLRWLAVTDDVPGGQWNRASSDIGVIDLNAPTLPPRWLTSTSYRDDQPAFSPDGLLLAYAANPVGRPEVLVMPISAEASQPIPVSREGGENPFWSTNGKTLYYSAGESLMAVDVTRTPTTTFSEPRRVFTMPNVAVVGVAPDNRFLGIRSTREPVTRLDVLLNWGELLKQRVR